MSQIYSMHEISENNGKDGKPVWIIIKNIVYDVTKLLNHHPGGDELILEYAGRDATRAFNDAGHSFDAIQDMKLYKIGIVDSQNRKRCETNTISTTQANSRNAESQQYGMKQKKRLKLFFCF